VIVSEENGKTDLSYKMIMKRCNEAASSKNSLP